MTYHSIQKNLSLAAFLAYFGIINAAVDFHDGIFLYLAIHENLIFTGFLFSMIP